MSLKRGEKALQLSLIIVICLFAHHVLSSSQICSRIPWLTGFFFKSGILGLSDPKSWLKSAQGSLAAWHSLFGQLVSINLILKQPMKMGEAYVPFSFECDRVWSLPWTIRGHQ